MMSFTSSPSSLTKNNSNQTCNNNINVIINGNNHSNGSKTSSNKKSYYVYYLGSQEALGLRGEQFCLQVLDRLLRQPQVAPSTVTLQINDKGLKILQQQPTKDYQLAVNSSNLANECKQKGASLTRSSHSSNCNLSDNQPNNNNTNNSASKSSLAGLSNNKSNKQIKHFIPFDNISYVCQQNDIVSCILLLYNPKTKCPLHCHAYRCDSQLTASALTDQLNSYILKGSQQKKLDLIERKLLAQGVIKGSLNCEEPSSSPLIIGAHPGHQQPVTIMPIHAPVPQVMRVPAATAQPIVGVLPKSIPSNQRQLMQANKIMMMQQQQQQQQQQQHHHHHLHQKIPMSMAHHLHAGEGAGAALPTTPSSIHSAMGVAPEGAQTRSGHHDNQLVVIVNDDDQLNGRDSEPIIGRRLPNKSMHALAYQESQQLFSNSCSAVSSVSNGVVYHALPVSGQPVAGHHLAPILKTPKQANEHQLAGMTTMGHNINDIINQQQQTQMPVVVGRRSYRPQAVMPAPFASANYPAPSLQQQFDGRHQQQHSRGSSINYHNQYQQQALTAEQAIAIATSSADEQRGLDHHRHHRRHHHAQHQRQQQQLHHHSDLSLNYAANPSAVRGKEPLNYARDSARTSAAGSVSGSSSNLHQQPQIGQLRSGRLEQAGLVKSLSSIHQSRYVNRRPVRHSGRPDGDHEVCSLSSSYSSLCSSYSNCDVNSLDSRSRSPSQCSRCSSCSLSQQQQQQQQRPSSRSRRRARSGPLCADQTAGDLHTMSTGNNNSKLLIGDAPPPTKWRHRSTSSHHGHQLNHHKQQQQQQQQQMLLTGADRQPMSPQSHQLGNGPVAGAMRRGSSSPSFDLMQQTHQRYQHRHHGHSHHQQHHQQHPLHRVNGARANGMMHSPGAHLSNADDLARMQSGGRTVQQPFADCPVPGQQHNRHDQHHHRHRSRQQNNATNQLLNQDNPQQQQQHRHNRRPHHHHHHHHHHNHAHNRSTTPSTQADQLHQHQRNDATVSPEIHPDSQGRLAPTTITSKQSLSHKQRSCNEVPKASNDLLSVPSQHRHTSRTRGSLCRSDSATNRDLSSRQQSVAMLAKQQSNGDRRNSSASSNGNQIKLTSSSSDMVKMRPMRGGYHDDRDNNNDDDDDDDADDDEDDDKLKPMIGFMYESLAAELKAKLGNPEVGPLLLPPKDYDTMSRKQGKLTGIELRRSTNTQIVGPKIVLDEADDLINGHNNAVLDNHDTGTVKTGSCSATSVRLASAGSSIGSAGKRGRSEGSVSARSNGSSSGLGSSSIGGASSSSGEDLSQSQDHHHDYDEQLRGDHEVRSASTAGKTLTGPAATATATSVHVNGNTSAKKAPANNGDTSVDCLLAANVPKKPPRVSVNYVSGGGGASSNGYNDNNSSETGRDNKSAQQQQQQQQQQRRDKQRATDIRQQQFDSLRGEEEIFLRDTSKQVYYYSASQASSNGSDSYQSRSSSASNGADEHRVNGPSAGMTNNGQAAAASNKQSAEWKKTIINNNITTTTTTTASANKQKSKDSNLFALEKQQQQQQLNSDQRANNQSAIKPIKQQTTGDNSNNDSNNSSNNNSATITTERLWHGRVEVPLKINKNRSDTTYLATKRIIY